MGTFGPGMPQTLKLDAFGARVFEAFGHHAYLVGSALEGKNWRDVDVRLMLPDAEFDALFPDHTKPSRFDPKWALICEALSDMAHSMTGLPVDFQIQRVSEANAEFDGARSPIGLRITG